MNEVSQGVVQVPKLRSRAATLGRRFLTVVAVVGMILLSLGAWGKYRFGTISAGLAYLSGNRVLLSTNAIALGQVTEGTKVSATLSVSNAGNHVVKVLGGHGSCSCMILTGLPFDLAPGESHSLAIEVDTKNKQGDLDLSVDLFTNDRNQPYVRFQVGGSVIPSAKVPANRDQTTGK